MTLEKGQLLKRADICWEQQEHQPHFGERNLGRHLLKHMGITPRNSGRHLLKHMGIIPNSLCECIIDVTFSVKTSTPWPGSDWLYNPGIRRVAPNGTKWICGPNVCPWLPAGWVGRCSLGFVFAPGRISYEPIKNPANLPFLRARWTRSVFHWYDYLAAVFVPSIGMADIMAHVDALTNFTQKALLDTKKAIEALK